MTLRDQIKQKQRPFVICAIAALVLFFIPVAFAPLSNWGWLTHGQADISLCS